jgi:hypothetical protein
MVAQKRAKRLNAEECYVFSVDYATLHQIIQQFMYTGVFRATIVASRNQRAEGHVALRVKEGTIYACVFTNTQGHVSSWDHWETQLPPFGVLNWELIPWQPFEHMQDNTSSRSPVLSQQSPVGVQKQSPTHTVVLSPSQLRQLPMLYRQVYTLIDGRRQSCDIARMLHQSQQDIDRILGDLSQQGLIQYQ